MRKRGFTLIELLAVVIILIIIISIAFPTVNSLIRKVKVNAFIINENIMVKAAKKYMNANKSSLPQNVGDTVEINLDLLQNEELIGVIKDPWNTKTLCDGYILITKTDDSYDYNPYLKCGSNYKANSYLEDDLIAYWELNGNSYDYTPNNHHGYINNVIGAPNRFQLEDTALNFQGPSNFIDTYYDYSFNYNQGASILVWVKFNTIDTRGKVKDILGKNSWEYIFCQIDNKISFILWDSNGYYATYLTSTIDIAPNTWYHLAVVYNNYDKSFSLYINGNLDTREITTATSFIDKTETLKIGRGYPEGGSASSSFFLGNIDNIAIYNRALSSNEINLYYDVDMIVDN